MIKENSRADFEDSANLHASNNSASDAEMDTIISTDTLHSEHTLRRDDSSDRNESATIAETDPGENNHLEIFEISTLKHTTGKRERISQSLDARLANELFA